MPNLSLSQVNKLNKPTITQIINLLYSWGNDEEKELFSKIQGERESAYRQKMTTLAGSVGCPRRGTPPRRESKRELERVSKLDAKSIVNTWNEELKREIARLRATNFRGNRFYYMKNLESWAAQRSTWKDVQISRNTRAVAENLALQDFMNFNEILLGGTGFIYGDQLPPVSDTCKRRFSLGIVTRQRMELEPTPAHPGCPHFWKLVVGRTNFNCKDLII